MACAKCGSGTPAPRSTVTRLANGRRVARPAPVSARAKAQAAPVVYSDYDRN